MSVIRGDLNKCIGCQTCVNICPMDVFYYDKENKKSIIAYPDNCQSCGMCYLNCPGRSLEIVNDMYGYALNAYRGPTFMRQNRIVYTDKGALDIMSDGKFYQE